MANDTINKLAQSVLDETLKNVKQDKHGIDPLTIILVIGIIINLIRVVQECRKDKSKLMSQKEKTDYVTTELKFFSFNHSLITRMRIRKIIKTHLSKDQYNKYGDALLKALLSTGKTVTDEQVSALLEYKHV